MAEERKVMTKEARSVYQGVQEKVTKKKEVKCSLLKNKIRKEIYVAMH